MTTNQKKSQNCSECRAISVYLEKELQELTPMLRRAKLTQRHNLGKPRRWNGFSRKLFEN